MRGTARGTLTWSTASGLAVQAQFNGIDASTLHSSAVTTNAIGQVTYTLIKGEQRFDGSARNATGLPLSADVVASIRNQVLELSTGRLRLGAGRADLRGRLELGGTQALQLSGNFADLDLSQLVRGIDTRLNGTLDVEGRLQAPLTGQGRFTLTDSRISGRPITGRGSLTLADRRFDADVELRSGDARLTALGGLGNGRELQVELVAPEIEPLLPGYAGRLDVRATIAGEIEAIRMSAAAAATDLRIPGGHRIASLVTSFNGGLAANEPLAVTVKLSGHTSPGGPDSSLAGATLVGRGTTTNATLELNGATSTQQPIRIIASGGVRDGAWHGSLVAAEVGAPLDLLMRAPAPLMISREAIALGPMDFQMRGARFMAVEVKSADGRWRTSGSFEGMQPQALDAAARAPRRVVRSGAGDRVPLTLAGRWDLGYTDAVSGIAVVERTGGDIYSGIDALNPIGVSDVGAALSVLDNRITGNVYMRGRALGKIDAEIDAYVDPTMSGGRLLAQNRPFRVVIDSTLPDLSWIGPLIGDNVQFGGKASINAAIGGTPADPTSTGTLRGEALRLAWVDQAVRLENGNLDAVLDDGVLVINELLFSGNPRVAPLNKRALEGLDSDRPFEVRAVGRIALRTLAGSIGVQATQLPVLQRADRWMVLSGSGGITLTPQRADLYAKLTVDGAYINFDNLRANRSLPNDVVVTRAGAQRKATTTAPVDVALDVKGNLGQRFYIEGAGLEARLAGEVNLSGRPSQLRAEGSVRTVDGVYRRLRTAPADRAGHRHLPGPDRQPRTERAGRALGPAGRGWRRHRRNRAAAPRPPALRSRDVGHREAQLARAWSAAGRQRRQRPGDAVGSGERLVLRAGRQCQCRTDTQPRYRPDHAAARAEQRFTAAARDRGRPPAQQRRVDVECRVGRLPRGRQTNQRRSVPLVRTGAQRCRVLRRAELPPDTAAVADRPRRQYQCP